MTLKTLIFKNIKQNFKKYGMYLFSVIFSVFTIYTFLAIGNSKDINAQFGSNAVFMSVFEGFTVVPLVFMFFYIKYINNHFIKQRKKEIATYSLFGMKNSKISLMIFTENMIIGLIGLFLGILVGILFYRFITLIFLSIIGTNATRTIVSFEVSLKAITTTLLTFIIYFTIIGIFGIVSVYHSKLLDLFNATKESEKKVKGSIILLIISIVLLSGGYLLAMNDSPLKLAIYAIPILILVIIGTILFFTSGIQIVLKFLRKRQKFILKGDNLLVISNFRHKIRSNAFMISVIAIVSAVAITAISTVYSMYYSSKENAYSMSTFDISFQITEQTKDYDQKIQSIINNSNQKIEENITLTAKALKNIKGQTAPYSKKNSIFLGSEKDYSRDEFYSISKIYPISQSKYNEIYAKQRLKYKKVKLKNDYESILITSYVWGQTNDLFKNNNIEIDNGKYNLTILNDAKPTTLPANGFEMNSALLIVTDKLYDQLQNSNLLEEEELSIKYINYTSPLEDNKLCNNIEKATGKGINIACGNYKMYLNLFGTLVFIGFFIGLVFLITTATLIYFKVMTDVEEEREYYKLLRNIGTNDKKEQRIIVKQIIPIFILPLLFAILHSIFAMKTVSVVFSIFRVKVIEPAFIMFTIYILIYLIFCIITIHNYQQKIKNYK